MWGEAAGDRDNPRSPTSFCSHLASLGDVPEVATTHAAGAAASPTRNATRFTIWTEKRITITNHLLVYTDFTSP
jgi:hypothetical protein